MDGEPFKVLGVPVTEETGIFLIRRFKRLKGVTSFGKAMKDLVTEKTREMADRGTEDWLLACFDRFEEEDWWREFDTAHIVRSFFKWARDGGAVDSFRKRPAEMPESEARKVELDIRTWGDRPNPAPAQKESPAPAQCPRLDFAARWNELVPSKPWNDFGASTRQLPRAYEDPEFAARFDEVCAAAAKLIDAGANLTFGYLLRYDAATSLYQWQNLLNGGLDWMARPGKKTSKATPEWVDKILAKGKTNG